MTDLYMLEGVTLRKLAQTDMVKAGGLTLSAAAAIRRFTALVLAQSHLYPEYREADAGDGWAEPTVGYAPDGSPCALIAAIIRTAGDVAADGRTQITERAQALQVAAAGAYAWPEAAAWVPLEQQARDWLARLDVVGPELAAAAVIITPLSTAHRNALVQFAQQQADAWFEAVRLASEALDPPPTWDVVTQQALNWLAEAAVRGPDLAADCGPEASVLETAERCASVISKADAFRATVGAIKRWRRQYITAIDQAMEANGPRADLEAIIRAAFADIPDGATAPAAG